MRLLAKLFSPWRSPDCDWNLAVVLEEAIAQEQMKREPRWSESVAVGSRQFLEKTQPLILSRRETEIAEAAPGLWALKEAEIPYRTKLGGKSAAKNLNDVSN